MDSGGFSMIKSIIEVFVVIVLFFSLLVAVFSGASSMILALINHAELYALYRSIFMRSMSVLFFSIAAHFLVTGTLEQIEWKNVNGIDIYKMIASVLLAIFMGTIAFAIYKMA